ncbi:ABC transporter permease [Paenibacillus kobensis]|uniref:ABC transporter permease n=1 Tax=Paenibacillus kobensis TaxID=59841 RepID=UPI000FDAF6D4|nr:ABC transporter permease [Paenibacillus kobensis]
MKILSEIYGYRELLFELVKRDLKIKYRRSSLGVIWSVLNPLLFMMITTIIFSTMFKNQIENFPIYFLSGQVMYAFFAESTGMAQTGLIDNGSLIKKVYTPKYIFPLSKICFSLVNMSFSLIAILIIIFIMGYNLPVTAALFFIPIILIFIFSAGVGLLLSSLTVIYRDILHIYGIFLSLLSFFSATFYPIQIIPASYRGLVEYNPVYVFIAYFRELVLNGRLPDLQLNIVAVMYCLVSVVVGYKVFKKNENKIVLYV